MRHYSFHYHALSLSLYHSHLDESQIMSSLVGRPIGGSIINKSSFIVIGLVVCTNLKCIYDTNCSHRQMIFIYIGNSMVRSRPELAHLLTRTLHLRSSQSTPAAQICLRGQDCRLACMGIFLKMACELDLCSLTGRQSSGSDVRAMIHSVKSRTAAAVTHSWSAKPVLGCPPRIQAISCDRTAGSISLLYPPVWISNLFILHWTQYTWPGLQLNNVH